MKQNPSDKKPNNIEHEGAASLSAAPPRLLPILDEPKVEELTSLSRTTLWRMERRGQFPKRVRLSPGRVGWHQADIEAWISSRAA